MSETVFCSRATSRRRRRASPTACRLSYGDLLTLDPEDTQTRVELATTLALKLASVAADPGPIYKEALSILEPLADAGKLTDEQQSAIGLIKAIAGQN